MARKINQFVPLQNQNDENENRDPVLTQIHSQTENPGAVIVPALFNGENYLPWSRSIWRAPIAKEKLSYIKEDTEIPREGMPTFNQWQHNDCMVTSWILNSMTKQFSEAFLYAEIEQALWKELEERFGGSNGPRLYQIKREISLLTQGNSSVMCIILN